MAEKGGGSVAKLWTKHGGGYYALVAVGTFLYLDLTNLVESMASAGSVQAFLFTELFSFFIETFINTFMASFWPMVWYSKVGFSALFWAGGGYLVWAFLLSLALNKREQELKRELGLD